MSTRSRIAIAESDGSYTSIYCHSDGYPRWNGRILRDHYTSVVKIRRLLKLGDISVLAQNTGRKHDFNWRHTLDRDFGAEWEAMSPDEQQNHLDSDGKPNRYSYEFAEVRKYPEDRMVRAFGRDRGDKGCTAIHSPDLASLESLFLESDQEWLYIYRGGRWLVTNNPDRGYVSLGNLPWDDTPHTEGDNMVGYDDMPKITVGRVDALTQETTPPVVRHRTRPRRLLMHHD